MAEKFIVEFNKQQIELEFDKPTRKNKMEWFDFMISLRKGAKELQKKKPEEFSDEETQRIITSSREFENKVCSFLLSLLHKNNAIVKESDFDMMANSDFKKLSDWFMKEIDLAGGSDKGFMKT